MHLSTVLLSVYCGLAAAGNPHPWMYGVPDYPDLDMEEVMTQAGAELLSEAASSATSTASNATLSSNTTASAGKEPCAAIGNAIAAAPPGARKVVSAELGLRCLMSVPLDKEGNVKLVDDIKLFVKWQSNTAYLKDPPANYTEKPVDIMGELDTMQKGLASGTFKTEYDFQMEMMNLFNRAYDNHFAYQPDILASAMQFQRPPGTELVSVSSDGKALPEVYTYQDIRKANNDSSFKPSPVKMINGMSAMTYLQNVSAQSDFHDADTRWNALFPSQALIASGTVFLGSFRTGQYQGPNTTMEFANGTTYNQMNVAVVFGNFTDVNSGQTFFKQFCTGPKPDPVIEQPTTFAAASKTNSTPTAAPTPSMIGYPKAVILNPNLAIGGYYINDTGYDDVAVLSLPSYESPDVQSFQNVMRDFIRMCKTQGKTKMIFDMRGNGGGNAILGYDTFKQVYPQADQEPFGGTRFRANDAIKAAYQLTGDFLANKTFVQSNQTAFVQAFGQDTTSNDILGITANFNFQHQLDVDNKAIDSSDAAFGPQQVKGDSFTTTTRYNFSDPISTSYDGFSVIGFDKNKNETSTPQPFKAQDMVMLHDGMCSSTCAIASELLKNQGAVRTIAVGGRPQEGPMQGVGGTKGAQVFSWDDIQTRMQATYFLGSPEQQKQWDTMDLGKTAFATQLFKRSAYSGGRIAGGVNLKDNLRQNDASGTPLEFMYEAADCRMWFTAPMITDVTELWKGVADRMFKNQTNMCVAGSTGDSTSVSAGGQKRAGDGTIAEGKGVNSTQRSAASGKAVTVMDQVGAMVGGAAGRAMSRWGSVAVAVMVSMLLY
ncbi:uncharacterized protein EKO05_0009561 [Ascochyta rabiei]|uniref:Serine-type peptidase n=1 Tax=Didymella rabiei TaxID=5454 RepID=A0A163CP40_DIDRA|nr:uncharacterized protein EKO05_0009561 [Ascochyta rabiei]KZM22602.1 serine-type peptidase [Ascochyta rabiei]UPX19293.1 hypothetical protein EKO05_0009561 [Ascochyta rabiei]